MPRGPAAFLCALAAAVALGGCGQDTEDTVLPTACTDEAQVRAALRAAPGDVRLADGTRLSACVQEARSDAQLTGLGVALTAIAEELADAAISGDREAATRLGYLIGAADRGSRRGQGVQLELLRRLEGAARRADAAGGARSAAVQAGLAAGRARG
jgi:hypothetical protein